MEHMTGVMIKLQHWFLCSTHDRKGFGDFGTNRKCDLVDLKRCQCSRFKRSSVVDVWLFVLFQLHLVLLSFGS